MPKFTTAIFDMDGVVIDSEAHYHKADAAFLGKYGAPYDPKVISPLLIGRNLKEGTGILKEMFGLGADLEQLFLERRALFAGVTENFVGYMPGFKEFFQLIKAKNLKACIATSGDDNVIEAIEKSLKLSQYFGSNIFRSSQVGNKSKPDPAIFLYAAQQMGARPEDCFVIEDAPRGVEAAKRAGMFCFGLAGTFIREKLVGADIIVDSFAEIKENMLA